MKKLSMRYSQFRISASSRYFGLCSAIFSVDAFVLCTIYGILVCATSSSEPTSKGIEASFILGLFSRHFSVIFCCCWQHYATRISRICLGRSQFYSLRRTTACFQYRAQICEGFYFLKLCEPIDVC